MKLHNHVSDYDVTNILNKLADDKDYMEMTKRDLSFLCGMLRDKMPKKVVEIGVAAGFTTNVIQTCLEELECDCEMYSVDYSRKYYRDNSKETGFLTTDVPERIKYKRCYGGVVSEFIEDICSDGIKIDFLIIDTVHSVPGEILDFIVCLPYLTDNCIVVLHDVGLNHLSNGLSYQYVTKLLFDVASGKKYFEDNITDEIDNIAAIMITEDTYDNIVDVFSCLSITWQYLPGEDELTSYKKIIKKEYNEKLNSMFCRIIDIQKNTFSVNFIKDFFKNDYNTLIKRWRQAGEVVIYGCGYYGRKIVSFANANRMPVSAIVISDDQLIPDSKEYCGIPIYHISDLNSKYENINVIIGVGDDYRDICQRNLEKLKIQYTVIS